MILVFGGKPGYAVYGLWDFQIRLPHHCDHLGNSENSAEKFHLGLAPLLITAREVAPVLPHQFRLSISKPSGPPHTTLQTLAARQVFGL